MKRRIFVGLAPILILIAGIGIYAIILFKELGSKVNRTLRENYRSEVAGRQMKDSIGGMNFGLFLMVAGEEEAGRKLYEQNVSVFTDNLYIEEHNVTLPGEQGLADGLRQSFTDFQKAAQQLKGFSDPAAKRQFYFEHLLPLGDRIRKIAQDVVRINEGNVLAENQGARDLSLNSSRYLLIAVIAGIGASLFFAFWLQRSIVRSIQTLTSVAKELGEGNLDQLVPVASRDELGELASAFNKLAAKLRAYRQVTTDQVLQARQMTEITLSAFPDPIFAYTPDKRFSFTNPAAERLLAKLNGQLPEVLLPEVDNILRGAPDFLPSSFEKAITLRLHGFDLHLLPRIIGMRDENGNLFGAAMILQDVTRFRLLDEVKTNLVSTVSHELKTPLTSIRMGLHLLLEERIGALNTKQTELLLAAREDSERLLKIINDLLDLARLESQTSQRVLQKIYPKTLITTVVEDLEPTIEANGCRLKFETESDLEPVAVDLQQIRHVFSNLISNAAKHSEPGNEILVRAQRRGDRIRFSVIDQGKGIPLEYQSKIFDRFFRIPGTERGGVGLGLAIAREIVLSHGGAIGLESHPGEGSEFYFDLPIAERKAA
ncbi:MAG: HAMP domain-containing protein [Verrucomicrobia bacterium]|nr:HAMP domain-containing protein [Verrucomicrobiota bacterium]MBV9275786.1 HAMP domain-containing protein [Verrucomicrobiota bacterium]